MQPAGQHAPADGLRQMLLQAVLAVQTPGASLQQRSEAINFIEQFKRSDVHQLLALASELTAIHLSLEVQLAGYSLLTDLVKQRWSELTAEERNRLTQDAFQNMGAVPQLGSSGGPLKGKAAGLLAAAVRQQGPATYQELLPRLMEQAQAGGAMQAELSCLVLSYISDDLMLFEGDIGGDAKRMFLSGLTASVPTVFPFLCTSLERQFQAGVSAAAAGRGAEASAAASAVSAALMALATWVEWTPMGRVAASQVVDACSYFLSTPDFRLAALDVFKQIAGRKRASEKLEDYEGLMDKVAAALLASCTQLGLLQPGGNLPAELIERLGFEGEWEELGSRLVDVLATFGEAHLRCVSGQERRLQYLQQMLAFTRHPYQPLSSLTLPFWDKLLRDAAAACSSSSGAVAADAAATPVAAQPLSPTGSTPGGRPRGGSTDKRHSTGGNKFEALAAALEMVPLECCEALVNSLAEQLQRTVLLPPASAAAVEAAAAASGGAGPSGAAAAVVSGEFPDWCDSYPEYKEACLVYRNQVKAIMRNVAVLAPAQALSTTSRQLETAMAAAGSDNGPRITDKAIALEAAIHLLEAVLPPICDAAAYEQSRAGVGGGGLLAGLKALLDMVLAVRLKEPLVVLLHARALEAFGRLLQLVPELVVPLVTAALSCLATLPLEAPGQLPPPPRQTLVWKKAFEARLGMANVVVGLAKACPGAFAPHLEPLAGEVQRRWEAGQLREGERVLLWEGLMTASCAAPLSVQTQLLAWVLSPLATQWATLQWQQHLASPLAFAQHYFPLEQSSEPSTSGTTHAAGGRAERWTLYHQVTLLERALRRTTPSGPATASASADGSSSSTQGPANGTLTAEGGASCHPMTSHLEWCLPPIATMLACVHGLGMPGVQASLPAVLRGVAGMDPLEHAVRLGQDRDAVKQTTSPRCVGGESLLDATYFVRGVRECGMMVLSLAAQHCPAMWHSPALAKALMPAATAHLQGVDLGNLRLLMRHVSTPWAVHCPPALRPAWVLPMAHVLLPHLLARLTEGWAALASGTAPAAGGAATLQIDSQRVAAEEVVVDTLLREASRQALTFLHATTNSAAGESAGGPGELGRSGGSGSHSLAPGAAHTANGAHPSTFELLLATDIEAAQAAVGLAVSALRWPDTDCITKGLPTCKYIASLAASSAPGLVPLASGELLRTTIMAVAQVSAVTIQSDIMGLLRQLLVSFLPTAPAARQLLLELPNVTPQVLSDFQAALLSCNSAKQQQVIVRQLLVQAGGEEMRKLLSVVSKVPVLSVAEPQPRERPGLPVLESHDAHNGTALLGLG